MQISWVKTVGLILSLMFVSACGTSQPTRYYLLSGIQPNGQNSQGVWEHTIGIGPVVLPSYMERREMVSRDSSNELNVAISHEWAEPVQENVSRVISENLGYRLGTDRIFVIPVKRSLRRSLQLDYQLTIVFRTFEKQMDGTVVLNASWRVLDKDKKELVLRRSEYSRVSATNDYAAQAAAQSQLLGKLSDEIASTMRELAAKR